jgi:hypothetical protein
MPGECHNREWGSGRLAEGCLAGLRVSPPGCAYGAAEGSGIRTTAASARIVENGIAVSAG